MEFLDKYGTNMPKARAGMFTGLNDRELDKAAKELGFVFSKELVCPNGLEHLPALPADSVIRKWERGTTYLIPVTDHPGITRLVIHNSAFPYEDRLLKKDHDDEPQL